MRITGGECRGRILKMPKGAQVRPTQDKVREAIFNVIKGLLPDSTILDLYAGSGAFGIEALSRGARWVIFVDDNTNCVKAIKDNLLVLGERRKKSQVLKMDAVRSISHLEEKKQRFDIVFLDPPYHKGLLRNCLIKINACDILSQHSFVIAEHFKKQDMPENLGGISLFKQKRYGDTVISFYRKK